jgi:uncharacterized repeat protein (TIGR04076 family)
MTDVYDVQITVLSQKGTCHCNHKVKDKWIVSNTTPSGICSEAYNHLFHDIRLYRFGGVLPWAENPDSCCLSCPDPENPVVFEIKRIRE